MDMEQKVDKILQSVQEIKIELAKSVVHQEQHRKEIDTITKRVNSHEKKQNWFAGMAAAVTFIGSAFFTWLFKHF